MPDDRCPGVFRTHPAADGRLARIRLPGGVIEAASLEALAHAAEEFGDGAIEMTVRGNLQVRAIADEDTDAFAAAMTDAGLVSTSAHDLVRNIAVSAFTGRVGGRSDLRPVAAGLNDALIAAPWAAGLSGRFWFGLDDGRGDVLARAADVTGVALGPASGIVVVDGEAVGAPVPLHELAHAMLTAAAQFVAVADGSWRVRDLSAAQRESLIGRLGRARVTVPEPCAPDPRVGWFDQHDGEVLLGAVLPFGRITAEQARFAAAIGGPVVVTPERELLFGDLDEAVADTVIRVLAPLGFVFDARSPWVALSACTGSPGCDKSHADVRGDLTAYVGRLDPESADLHGREHWVGCDRGCGSPGPPHVRFAATPDGYVRSRRN